MKILSATYEHHCLGFYKVQLKWHYDGIYHIDPYVTIDGVIDPRGWKWAIFEKIVSNNDLKKEMERFEKWVVAKFSDDPTVQG